ncbi:MAG: hypothetical protein KIS91_05105 [Anaerolineae bacterium]|nr:hypothetical protein [Anaerolineae bacterium]
MDRFRAMTSRQRGLLSLLIVIGLAALLLYLLGVGALYMGPRLLAAKPPAATAPVVVLRTYTPTPTDTPQSRRRRHYRCRDAAFPRLTRPNPALCRRRPPSCRHRRARPSSCPLRAHRRRWTRGGDTRQGRARWARWSAAPRRRD